MPASLSNLPWWIWYLIVVNLITFLAFGLDKARSQKLNARRTPEKTLWGLLLIGGTPGGLFGMNYFRHKTKKLSFQAAVALILAAQIGFLYFFVTNF